jgi:hypothetical protein
MVLGRAVKEMGVFLPYSCNMPVNSLLPDDYGNYSTLKVQGYLSGILNLSGMLNKIICPAVVGRLRFNNDAASEEFRRKYGDSAASAELCHRLLFDKSVDADNWHQLGLIESPSEVFPTVVERRIRGEYIPADGDFLMEIVRKDIPRLVPDLRMVLDSCHYPERYTNTPIAEREDVAMDQVRAIQTVQVALNEKYPIVKIQGDPIVQEKVKTGLLMANTGCRFFPDPNEVSVFVDCGSPKLYADRAFVKPEYAHLRGKPDFKLMEDRWDLQKQLLKLVPAEYRPLFTAFGVFSLDEIERRCAELSPSLTLLYKIKGIFIINPI